MVLEEGSVGAAKGSFAAPSAAAVVTGLQNNINPNPIIVQKKISDPIPNEAKEIKDIKSRFKVHESDIVKEDIFNEVSRSTPFA